MAGSQGDGFFPQGQEVRAGQRRPKRARAITLGVDYILTNRRGDFVPGSNRLQRNGQIVRHNTRGGRPRLFEMAVPRIRRLFPKDRANPTPCDGPNRASGVCCTIEFPELVFVCREAPGDH